MIHRLSARWAPRFALALTVTSASSVTLRAQYAQTNLVSDIPGMALNTDADLKNPWGMSFSPTSPFWISDAKLGITTLYTAGGVKLALKVTIPGPGGVTSEPAGQVFNNTGSFQLSDNANATFLFATTNGTIAGWNGSAGTTALTQVTGSPGTSYTGLAIAGSGSTARLYAANFGTGHVDVFDGTFSHILPTSFVDPSLPPGYAPFNVQNVGGNIVVTYALKNPVTGDDIAGPGNGLVDVYDPNGTLLRRVVSDGALNSPWGIALAPGSFGPFGGALLVGNFGDGTIHAYDFFTGALLGELMTNGGAPIVNDGLWSIAFGNNGAGSSPNTLYLTAGINGEQDGLFASIVVTPEPSSLVLLATGLGAAFASVRRRRGKGEPPSAA